MTTLLCILDGWGHSDNPKHNAIAAAHTPVWDGLLTTYPYGILNASEEHVGLPHGQMGNSEVGHMHIGAGRVIMQDLPRINKAIADDTLIHNPELTSFIDALKLSGGDCHLMGLLSDGGVHAHIDHILALAHIIAHAGITVWIHAFLDGRDTPPQSAGDYIAACDKVVESNAYIQWGTVSGRYYAMDRDKRWERVEKTYDAIILAQGEKHSSAAQALRASYENNITDEFILPTVIGDYSGIHDGDAIIMANFRSDRAREILSALLDPQCDGFTRKAIPSLSTALGMVEYSTQHNAWMRTLFLPETLHNTIGEVIANINKTQLRIAETEKYAHVTFFANGGREEPFAQEERILVPSPKVATYDLQPEMSAFEVTEKLVNAIESNRYDFIFVNYANTDMVGHSGKFDAAVKAVEAVDNCLGKVINAIEKTHSNMIISADHGNAECMRDHNTSQPHTAHTLNLVPVVVIHPVLKGNDDVPIPTGSLIDLAPTALTLMGIDIPKEMSGTSLIHINSDNE